MVGNKVLSETTHPRQIAHAHLPTGTQCERDPQPGGISQSLGTLGDQAERLRCRQPGSDLLGMRQIQAQQVTSLLTHPVTITAA